MSISKGVTLVFKYWERERERERERESVFTLLTWIRISVRGLVLLIGLWGLSVEYTHSLCELHHWNCNADLLARRSAFVWQDLIDLVGGRWTLLWDWRVPKHKFGGLWWKEKDSLNEVWFCDGSLRKAMVLQCWCDF